MSRPHTPDPSSEQNPPPARRRRTKSGKGKHKAIKSAAGNVLEALPTVLDAAKDVASNFGVPGLETGFAALSKVVEKIQTSSANIDGVEELSNCIDQLKRVLERFRGKSVPASVQERINTLFSKWETLGEEATELKSRNCLVRFLRSDMDAKQLSGFVEKYNRSLTNAQLESALNTEVIVVDIQAVVHKIEIRLDDSFMPTHAKKAQYDANILRRGCLTGTRVKILGRIGGWIEKNAAQLAAGSTEGDRIIWVNGLAGAGKTTIVFSVAEECSKQNRLAATFFCALSDPECSNPSLIFVTIARQMCRIYPAYKEKVIEVLKGDPDIINAGVSRQLEKLIVEPLEALKGTLPVSVVVIDALDECRDPNTTSTILSALAKFIERLAPLLFIIASRPEQHIAALFRKYHDPSLAAVTTPLILHEVEPESVSEDIMHVLDEGFTKIRASFEIDYDWPSPKDAQQLKTLSNGLFIFATTALGFIADRNFSDPEGQLQSLLARQSLPQPASSIMDSLYLQVLERAYPKPSDPLTAKLQTILGAITLAEESLSTTGFADLLGIPEPSVTQTLSGLRSVLHIPEDKSQPIGVIHATFPQFLLRESPYKPAAFHIRSVEGHIALLSRCLDVLNTDLRRDVIEIKNPTLLKREIFDLSEKIPRHIPSHLGYVCRSWAAHLQGALAGSNLDGLFVKVQAFLHNTLLYWIEACGWLDALVVVVKSLITARLCFASTERLSTFIPLLTDCRRFALAYAACIEDAPLQVYYSALSLAPRSSLVVQTYAKETQHPLVINEGALTDWGPYMATLPRRVYSVIFAPDGSGRFMTGGEDNTVDIWESTTCTRVLSMDGHTGAITSVGYSPDAIYIVSGSQDHTVRLWDAESGAHIWTLAGHTASVDSITYSTRNRILSSTREGEVKLWDASDRQCTLTFNTRANLTRQVSISPDGSRITYCTDSYLCLRTVATEERLILSPPRNGNTALLSSHGRYIAGATETMIFIYSLSGELSSHPIEVPQGVCRVAFSCDDMHIGWGCKDGSVRLWRMATNDPPLVLTGHRYSIRDIAWSPDGSRLISAGADGIARVWDLSPRPHEPMTRSSTPSWLPISRFAVIADTDTVTLCDLPQQAVAWTSCDDGISLPEGAPFITLCHTIREAWGLVMSSKHGDNRDHRDRCMRAHAWEFWTGRRMFQRPSSSMPSVLSQDGSLLAYAPLQSDQSVHICDLRVGTDVLTFSHGHPGHITAVSFSADGKRLATGSAGCDVRVWELASGRLVASHESHTRQVESIALSSDGRIVVSGQRGDGGAQVFDAESGHTLEWRHDLSSPADFVFTPDDKAIVALTPFSLMVWDIATETHTCHNLWLDHVNFSSDGTGIALGEDHATIQLWQRGERTWPVYTMDNDGWVYAKRPGLTQRLCWLPAEWRNPLSSDSETFCVFDYNEQKLVELDMSRLLLGAETWSQ